MTESEGRDRRLNEEADAMCPVVGLGASAGGLNALKSFLESVPSDGGLAYVVITHLSPDYPSQLPEILRRITDLPVEPIADDQPVSPNHAYMLPVGSTATIAEGRLMRSRRDTEAGPIDTFLMALAEDSNERAAERGRAPLPASPARARRDSRTAQGDPRP